MASGCGMNILSKEMPERFFDVGIEEEHAVTFSAGLAAGGLKPFCNIYSSFSQRAFDQIIHDVALQDLPVVLCLDRGGLVGEDGATHHGCYDMAAYRTIPGAIIAAPRNESELKDMMYTAMMAEHGPFIIRYPRGNGEGVDWEGKEYALMTPGRAETVMEGTEVAVICAGPIANRVAEVAEDIRNKTGWNPAVYNIRYIKPIDTDLLKSINEKFSSVITVEDGTVVGGLHGAVAEYMSSAPVQLPVKAVGIPDEYVGQGTQDELRRDCGLDKCSIEALISKERNFFFKKDEKVLEI
jgi:1-deoxy-D-xylulose-5-phosphate synthase